LWYGVFVSPGKTNETRAIGDRELSEFLLRACHDLRSSVRAIRAQAELLQRDGPAPATSDSERRLAFIVDGVRKIELLSDGMSGYSIALQIQEASFQPTRMDAVLRTALGRLDKELRDQEAEVTSGELPCVSGNSDRLTQVFENLLRNALRHRGQSSPRIHITAEKQAAADRHDEWLFAVRDNGPGIDTPYLERIFKPFERLRADKPEGSGMGLAICRAIVERHGGKLWAESTPGSGSTFLFTLPVVSQ
jgi:two-component system, chemotaxis family, sensor kinase Cph1